MKTKTYRAESMATALQIIKHELGRDAVILHTRTGQAGGLFGWGAKSFVEVTATNDLSVLPPQVRRKASGESERPASSRGHVLARAYGAAPAATKRPDSSVRVAVVPAPPVVKPPLQSASDLDEEVRQIRRMVQRMMERQSGQERSDLPDQLFDRYLALLEQEVSAELADEVLANARQTLPADQTKDEKAVAEVVRSELAKLIPVSDAPAPVARTPGRPRTIALIGPTGVGKTTTIAKLAATFKLRDQLKVALITIDTYRIAAVDQLKTYADIIGLPVEVVLTPEEMRGAMARCANYDVILIDTAGRGQRDDRKLEELCAFIRAAEPTETHLVLSSTCGQSVLMETVDRFACIPHDRLIFTKLDEAVSFGVLLNVVRRVGKRLSYITTGQEVPHQIESGTSDRLASLIMGGQL